MVGRVRPSVLAWRPIPPAKPLDEGDRIVYNYFFPCGRCVACLRGQPARAAPVHRETAATAGLPPVLLRRTAGQQRKIGLIAVRIHECQ